jgi:DNA-binding beta-propeller fold protein YncE
MDNDQLTAARLRFALDREVAKHQLSPGAWPRLERRLRRQPWRRAAIAAVCALIVAAVAAVTPYLWHNLSGPAASHPHPQPGPHLVIGARAHVSSTGPLTTGYEAVWLIGPGVIYRVDPATARTVATIPAPGTGGKLSGITIGAGAVWATSAGGRPGVYRIDPRTNRVTSFIRLPPTPTAIAVAHGRVWVTEPKEGPGIVVRIDPRTNRISGPPIRVGAGPGEIVSSMGTLWVTNSSGISNVPDVSRINPATGAVANPRGRSWGGTDRLGNAKVSRIDAAGAGSLWTTDVNVVERVDPATGHVTAAIPVPHAWHVIFWHGLAWALTAMGPSGLGTVVGIDPASNRVIVHRAPFHGAPMAIAAGPAGLWLVFANPGHTSQQLVHLVLDPGPS